VGEPLHLYGYARSMAAYRVRVALRLKGVAFRETFLDLRAGDQFAADFLALNPEGAVPTLIAEDGATLSQSLAILEYLEERHPEPPLLPAGPAARARVRSLANLIASDTHPLLVPRVSAYLRDEAGLDERGVVAWSRHWVSRGIATAETRLARDSETGAFCHGDTPTLADICLASLGLLSQAAGLQLRDAPTVSRILANCEAHEAFRIGEG
jgi:maleylacetoacetate isomerase